MSLGSVTSSGVTDVEAAGELRRRLPLSQLCRPVVAAAVLLILYLGLGSLTNDGGYLGTDTGGKVATLDAMSSAGRFDPDVGYWAAEFDPEGSLHPLFYTARIGERYVNVTTLPMLAVALPLYDQFGYRGAVVVPAIGAVLAALGARALARRLDDGAGWDVFWVVGLATPVAVYALDLWEHAPGLALVVWATVALVDTVEENRPWWWAGVAGVLFGVASTMRTESLVYAAAIIGAGLITSLARRGWRPALVGSAVAAAAGGAVGLVANEVLERIVYSGGSVRSARTTGAAARAGADAVERLQEGLITTFGVASFVSLLMPVLVGVMFVGLTIWAVTPTRRANVGRRVLLTLGGGAVVLAVAVGGGLGFVPGMFIAAPFAAVGLVGLGPGRWRWLAIAVIAALPVVWLFQFPGGAGPQWGGRYQLTTGLVLVVFGVIHVRKVPRPVGIALMAVALAITGVGVAWTVVRSNQVADAFEVLVERDDELLISRSPFFLREGGAAFEGRPWLSISTRAEFRAAVELAERLGIEQIVVLAVGDDNPPTIEGWRPTDVEAVALFDDDLIYLQSYVEDRP